MEWLTIYDPAFNILHCDYYNLNLTFPSRSADAHKRLSSTSAVTALVLTWVAITPVNLQLAVGAIESSWAETLKAEASVIEIGLLARTTVLAGLTCCTWASVLTLGA